MGTCNVLLKLIGDTDIVLEADNLRNDQLLHFMLLHRVRVITFVHEWDSINRYRRCGLALPLIKADNGVDHPKIHVHRLQSFLQLRRTSIRCSDLLLQSSGLVVLQSIACFVHDEVFALTSLIELLSLVLSAELLDRILGLGQVLGEDVQRCKVDHAELQRLI
jgi:hypothetical protein